LGSWYIRVWIPEPTTGENSPLCSAYNTNVGFNEDDDGGYFIQFKVETELDAYRGQDAIESLR